VLNDGEASCYQRQPDRDDVLHSLVRPFHFKVAGSMACPLIRSCRLFA
jgi:hypothetical protein